MLSIPRSVARLVRATFRKLGDSNAGRPKLTTFRADVDGLRLQARSVDVGAEYHIAGAFPTGRFAISLESLAASEGRGDDAVTFHLESGGDIRMEWMDAGVPQQRQVSAGKEDGNWLTPPTTLQQTSDGALRTIIDAMQTTLRSPTRFALGRIQLRGKGEVVGTDGHQLLLVRGLEFPWRDNLLVPRTRVLELPAFVDAERLEIGRTEDDVVVRAGPWTVWLRIDKDGRFPNVDKVIPAAEESVSRIVVAEDDAGFLLQAVPRLPANDEDGVHPVTVHANGHVVVRARSSSSPLTELVLNRSRTIGDEIMINLNRDLFCRALGLGIREFRFAKDVPIVGESSDRTFVFLPFQGHPVLGPSDDALRIESVPKNPYSPPITPTRKSPTMNDKNPPPPKNNVDPLETDAGEELVGDPIQEAEALRSQLREVLNRVGRLLHSLKRQRRQAQLVRSTLASLKQLQEVA